MGMLTARSATERHECRFHFFAWSSPSAWIESVRRQYEDRENTTLVLNRHLPFRVWEKAWVPMEAVSLSRDRRSAGDLITS